MNDELDKLIASLPGNASPDDMPTLRRKVLELDKTATPGPWRDCSASDGKCSCRVVYGGDERGGPVALAFDDKVDNDWEACVPKDQFQANKDLIAYYRDAAPRLATENGELLASLKMLDMVIEGAQDALLGGDPETTNNSLTFARKAIQRALGSDEEVKP